MIKILKNTTLSDIDISDLGLTIFASGQVEIEPTDYPKLALTTQLSEYISSGVIVVNNGFDDLDIDEGLNYVGFYPDKFSYDTIVPTQTIVIPANQQYIVYDQIEIEDGAEIVLNGSLVILE